MTTPPAASRPPSERVSLLGRAPFDSTDALIKRVNEAQSAHEELAKLRPGQQVRIQFAMSIRHLAHIMKADPMSGLHVLEMLESELERTVEEMFAPRIHQAYGEGVDEGYDRARRDPNALTLDLDSEATVISLIKVGCAASDIHLGCSFPECTCRHVPDAVRAVIAAIKELSQ